MFVAGKKRKAADSARPRAPAGSAQDTAAKQIERVYRLGSESLRQRQYRAALDHFNRGIALASNAQQPSAKLFEKRALALLHLREFARVASDAQQAIALDSNSAHAYALLARGLMMQNKPSDALTALERGRRQVSPMAAGFRYLATLQESVRKQLDPAYVPKQDPQSDPVVRLPVELNVLILQQMDLESLLVCRRVSRAWQRLVDGIPALWGDISVADEASAGRPMRVSARVLRLVLRLAGQSLVAVNVPDGSLLGDAALAAVRATNRPLLRSIHIGRLSASASALGQLLGESALTSVRLPYCSDVTDSMLEQLSQHLPTLRILDISGCAQVRMKTLFRQFRTATLQELYLNDHPGLPEFLVYCVRYRTFASLRVLHIAVYDQAVFAQYSGLGPLMVYLGRLGPRPCPFPELRSLNMDGIWEPTVSSRRFESAGLKGIISSCNLVPAQCRSISAREASVATDLDLFRVFHTCMSTIYTLHLTKAVQLTDSMVRRLTGTAPLILVDLDLSGCAALSAEALRELVAHSPQLLHVKLMQTRTDNAVLRVLTEHVVAGMGAETLDLAITDVTGAGARDFAVACARRFRAKPGRRLRVLNLDYCESVGADAVAVMRDLLMPMGTLFTAAMAGM